MRAQQIGLRLVERQPPLSFDPFNMASIAAMWLIESAWAAGAAAVSVGVAAAGSSPWEWWR